MEQEVLAKFEASSSLVGKKTRRIERNLDFALWLSITFLASGEGFYFDFTSR